MEVHIQPPTLGVCAIYSQSTICISSFHVADLCSLCDLCSQESTGRDLHDRAGRGRGAFPTKQQVQESLLSSVFMKVTRVKVGSSETDI